MDDGPIDYGQYERGSDCNYWDLDGTLRFEAERLYPDDEFEWAEPVLRDWGEAIGHRLAAAAAEADRTGMELRTYDRDGEVANEVKYPAEIEELEWTAYEEFGLTHDAFHAPPGRDEPLGLQHTLTMQTFLSFVGAGFVCPASMTTGAAIVLDKYDDGSLQAYLDGLTARNHEDHIEGAMFLTEKQGGSDVGANEVRAEPQDDGTYELYGEKWFCSNIDAQGALALARTPDAPEGTKGLSLFLVPRVKPDGEINDSLFRRLKDKLGTLNVPTGEIEFRGAEAYLVGEEGAGFKYMAEMMNFERLTNATGAVGIMGRALLESKVRAANREAFGNPIQEYPLMQRDLVEMTVDYEAAAAFTFAATRFYDQYTREEGEAAASDVSDEAAFRLMRLLVPVAKYKTARMSVDTASYAMEVLGGNGYVNGWATEQLFRDAQVLPIWEGTSNILSLDVLRVLNREAAHEALIPWVSDLLEVEHPYLQSVAADVQDRFTQLQEALLTLATEDEDYAQYHAKRLADLLFDVVSAAVLVDEAQDALDAADDARKAVVARSFVDSRFGDDYAYGVKSGDRSGMEEFDVVARYARKDPADLDVADGEESEETAPATDDD
ncbi:acyl-CoA dehydrogenase family protein [Salinirubellus salinus]|uniref:Acyl-CoA dehydrogenase family protein n=1 Tax=Salinirubellus salinus TaxID=1364945 RepID=A0A9E7R5M7_9EURY|nr:acyl-CoA dehydrogenase family protein [Salinirubellus salinus]UWM55644.1 acyl-CoA dehydrogenase family protein [Salinirubellus salinus]